MHNNTLLIVTSDHGELFGEYGYFAHGGMLKRPLVHIPLILHHRSLIPEPGVREIPVSIADIFHTIIELLELDGAAPTGTPMRNLLDPHPVEAPSYSQFKIGRTPEAGFVYQHDSRSVWNPDRRHFILTETEEYECYDLAADFAEQTNLCPRQVSKEQVVSEVTAFEAQLKELVETPQDLHITQESRIDPQQERAMRALGYVGGGTAGRSSENLSWHGREHFNTGVFHLGRGEYDPAREEFNKSLIIDQNYRPAHVALGQLLFREKQYHEALQHFLKISSKFPGDPEIQRLTTVLYALNGKPKQAERLFLGLAELYPEMAPKFFNQQGNMFLRRREPEPALILFDLLRHRFPEVAAYKKGYQDALRLKKKSQGRK